jgi:hypothetical protein
MKKETKWMFLWMIPIFLFGCGAVETPAPPPPAGPASSEGPSNGGLANEVDPCTDAEFATSLSLPEGISSEGRGPFLHHRTQDALYLVSGTNLFRRLKGRWELFYRYPAPVEARIDDAVLDETTNLLYLSLHHSGTRDFDILKLDLADAATESLVTDSLLSQICPGDPLNFRLSLDPEAGVLYAACGNRLFSKRKAEDWRLILGEVAIEAVIGFSRGRIPTVCAATPEGVLCREGEGDWFRVGDGSGVDSTGDSHEIRFRYNAADDRLYALFYRLSFYSDRRCRLLASRGLKPWENLTEEGDNCFTSLAVDEESSSLYLVADQECELSSYLNGVKVVLGSVGATIPLYGLEGFYGDACPSDLVLDSGRRIVYTPVYNNPCGAVDGFCASPRDVVAVCMK